MSANDSVMSDASEALMEAMMFYEKKLGHTPDDTEGEVFMAALTAVCMSGVLVAFLPKHPDEADRWLALAARLAIELTSIDDGPKTRITIIRE